MSPILLDYNEYIQEFLVSQPHELTYKLSLNLATKEININKNLEATSYFEKSNLHTEK